MSGNTRVADTAWMRDVHRRNKRMNRRLSPQTLHKLDEDGKHIVQMWLIHEHANGVLVKPHYRCKCYLKMEGHEHPAEAFVDVPIKDFDALPTVEQVKAWQEVEA